jgi:chemotaxis signal transduction protein
MSESSPQGLILTVKGQRHVLALRHVVRLLPFAALANLPSPAPAVLGLLDLQGQALPVLDLQVLLGGPASPETLSTRIAVLSEASCQTAACPPCALAVRGTGSVIRLAAQAERGREAAQRCDDPLVWAVSRDSRGTLLWLDLPALLGLHARSLLRQQVAAQDMKVARVEF